MPFHFLDVLTSGTLPRRERLPPRVGQFLKILKDSPASVPFICKPANPKYSDRFLYLALTIGGTVHPPSLPQGDGPGVRQLETALCPRACRHYSDQPILHLLPLPGLTCPKQTTRKAPAHIVSQLPPPPDGPWCFSLKPYVACPDPLSNNFLRQGHHFRIIHMIQVLPYLIQTNPKPILKHHPSNLLPPSLSPHQLFSTRHSPSFVAFVVGPIHLHLPSTSHSHHHALTSAEASVLGTLSFSCLFASVVPVPPSSFASSCCLQKPTGIATPYSNSSGTFQNQDPVCLSPYWIASSSKISTMIPHFWVPRT